MSFCLVPVAYGKSKAKETPSPSATTTPSISPTPTRGPRWTPPPPVDESAKWINYRVASALQSDINGTNLYSLVDLYLRRRLDKNNVSAEGDIRLTKDFSNSYNADTFQIRTADVSYSDFFLTAAAGRLNVGDPLSPMKFFGNYSTMGIRRLDGIQLTLPIHFSVGVVDSGQSIDTSSTALSLFYFPSIFSTSYVNYDTTQSFFLGQARVSANLWDIPFIVRFNMGGCSNDFYDYSVVNGDLTYSASLAFTVKRDFDFYCEYGVQDATFSNQSNVFGFGVHAQHIYTIGPLSIDDLIGEMQVPIGYSLNNTFTGGNNLNSSASVLPQKTWFVELKTRIKAINLNFFVTNSTGDYTFARLNKSNALSPAPGPINQPVGMGNEVDGLGVPFVGSSYSNISYIGDVEVTF